MPLRAVSRRRSLFGLALIVCLAGCSSAYWREDADEEVSEILGEKQSPALGEDSPVQLASLRVDQPQENLRQSLLAQIETGDRPTLELDLKTALEVAAENSREFQTQRETLYLSALALTGQRFRFSNLFTGDIGADITGNGTDFNSTGVDSGVGFSRILSTGGQILGSFVVNFFRLLTDGSGYDASSLLSLTFNQPLLRGAGPVVIFEPLTQSERNVIYAVRNYERFRRGFLVNLVAEYLSVLEQENNLANTAANLRSLEDNLERSRALARAGRLPQFEVDQARQQVLSAQDAQVLERARTKVSRDRFKLTLGLPIEFDLVLDYAILGRLREVGVGALSLTQEEAIQIALERRLDLMNTRDQLVDAERQVTIAEQNLLMDLDLSASIGVPNRSPDQPLKLEWQEGDWTVALDAVLPFQRIPERNTYRSSLIALASQRRALDNQIDTLQQALINQLIDLDQAWRSYRIQVEAVELAERRADSTRILVEAGRAQTRDFLDSEQALLSSRNALTSQLVNYVNAKLRLLRDLELLDTGPDGLILDLEGLKRWSVPPEEGEGK